MERRNVLEGYVSIESISCSEADLCNIARISTGKEETDDVAANKRLIKHLLKSGHMSIFEFMNIRFRVSCPIFVARQWMRHRNGVFCERSGRKTKAEPVFHFPNWEKEKREESEGLCQAYRHAWNWYLELLKKGVPREEARSVLPVGTYTEFFWGVDMRSLLNFLQQRLARDAQQEIWEYAIAILDLLWQKSPVIAEHVKSCYLRRHGKKAK